MGFRFAAPTDSTALLAIYGQYLDTPTTFECVLPSEEEFAGAHHSLRGNVPLSGVGGGRADRRGYAYAHRQAERAAYQWRRGAVRLPGPGLHRTGRGPAAVQRPDGASSASRASARSMAVSPCQTRRARGSTGPWGSRSWAPITAPATSAAPGTMWPGLKGPSHPMTRTRRPSAPSERSRRRRWRRSCGGMRPEKKKTRGAIWLRVFVFWWIRTVSPCRRGRSSPWCRGSCPTGCR